MKNCLILFFFCFASAGFSQNLVPNPSFEDTVMCPTAAGQVELAKFWEIYRETPDYFNTCAAIWQQQIPNNFFGFQDAATGNAYMGVWTFADIEYREFFGLELSSPLQQGIEYYYEYKVSKAQNLQGYGWVASNKIGLKFFNGEYSVDYPLPINSSQTYTSTIITDTTNWVLISGHFISDSNYTHLSIGNHFHDSETDTIQVVSGGDVAYYYIDDVCISQDSIKCKESFQTSVEMHSQLPTATFYDNILRIKQGYNIIKQIIVLDVLGKELFKTNRIEIEYDLSYLNFSPSIYNVLLETSKSTTKIKIIKP